MVKHQRFQILKLPDSIVRGTHCLVTLISTNTDSNVGFGDHAYIVCTIANGQGDFLRLVLLYKSNNLSLLFWRESAADQNLAGEG